MDIKKINLSWFNENCVVYKKPFLCRRDKCCVCGELLNDGEKVALWLRDYYHSNCHYEDLLITYAHIEKTKKSDDFEKRYETAQTKASDPKLNDIVEKYKRLSPREFNIFAPDWVKLKLLYK